MSTYAHTLTADLQINSKLRHFVCFEEFLTQMSETISNAGRISFETGFTVFSLAEIITGSFLNGFVIFLLFLNRRLLEIPANLILLSLSISDFLSCSVVLPYHLYEILHLRETLVHHAALLFSMTLGMFGIVLLTADRFCAIIWPLRYGPQVTMRRTRLVLVANWSVSFLYAGFSCVAVVLKKRGLRYFLSFVNFTAVLIIFVLYSFLFRAACRHIKMMHDRERLARAVGFFVFKRTLKSAKTCGSVVLVFAVTYLPL